MFPNSFYAFNWIEALESYVKFYIDKFYGEKPHTYFPDFEEIKNTKKRNVDWKEERWDSIAYVWESKKKNCCFPIFTNSRSNTKTKHCFSIFGLAHACCRQQINQHIRTIENKFSNILVDIRCISQREWTLFFSLYIYVNIVLNVCFCFTIQLVFSFNNLWFSYCFFFQIKIL